MLDERLVGERPEVVIADLEKRGEEELIQDVKRFAELYRKRKEIREENVRIRQERNRLTREIQERKERGEDVAELLERAKEIPRLLRESDERLRKIEEEMRGILLRLPNLMHESVPVGKDDSENVPIRYWGKLRAQKGKEKELVEQGLEFEYSSVPIPSHVEFEGILFDTRRAAKTSGSRFFFLKTDLVLLEYSLIRMALDFLWKKGWEIVEPPFMVRRRVEEGVTALSDFEDVIYKVEDEDLYLIPTSEHSIAGMLMDEVLAEDELPVRVAGISPCFRKEAGSHGKDTKGIFRTHQFMKVEQFIFSHPEKSWEHHEELIRNAEEFFQLLEVPYRVVNICTGDLGVVAAKKYDIEAWLPGQGRFREVVSCSNCTEWQARRLNIRFRKAPGEPARFVHTLNSTLVATNRAMIAIMENHWEGDGFRIPKALQPYFGRDFVRVKARKNQ